jgi:hypothetical protein
MRVIYDPHMPGKAARRLTEAGPSDLVPFSAAPERLEAARRVPSSDRFAAVFWTFGAVVFWYGVVRGLVPLSGPVLLTPFALATSIAAWRAWRQDRIRRRPALLLKYHRRYVVPSADLDQEATQAWSRAAEAADMITGSEVIKEQLVDSVRVSVVLPDWLWEIAEKLALLSEVRARQREILSGLDASTPEVAVALDRHRRVRDIAAADVERKVRQLEVLAGRVAEADGAVRKVRAAPEAVRELAALNDSHADLLARVDHSGAADAHEAGLLSRDLQAVIAHADEAVRQANEAANSLVLPGE